MVKSKNNTKRAKRPRNPGRNESMITLNLDHSTDPKSAHIDFVDDFTDDEQDNDSYSMAKSSKRVSFGGRQTKLIEIGEAGVGVDDGALDASAAKRTRTQEFLLSNAEITQSLGGDFDLDQSVVQLQTSSKRKLPRPKGGDRDMIDPQQKYKKLAMIGGKSGGIIKEDDNERGKNNRTLLAKQRKKAKSVSRKNDVNEDEDLVDTKVKLLALNYLVLWRKSPEVWKFQKVRQTWLLKHMYDEETVPKKYFKYLLKYLTGLKGQARTKTLTEAKEVLVKGGNGDEMDLAEGQSIARAGKVIQLLDID